MGFLPSDKSGARSSSSDEQAEESQHRGSLEVAIN